jgi:hypothetical protein
MEAPFGKKVGKFFALTKDLEEFYLHYLETTFDDILRHQIERVKNYKDFMGKE